MKNLILVITVLFALGCAKVREVNVPGDGDKERVQKSFLTGLEPLKSNDIRNFSNVNRFDTDAVINKGKAWLQKITVTNVSASGGPLFIGLQNDTALGYFKFGKDTLEFLSVVNPNRADDKKTDDIIYSWNVKHSEYRYNEIDGKPTNTLVEDEYIPWYKKTQFMIDWAGDANIVWGNEELGECWKVASSVTIPESQVYEDGYISFTKKVTYTRAEKCWWNGLRNFNTGRNTFQAEFMYSFKLLEAEKNPAEKYEPYVYNRESDPLIQKYGYFKTLIEEEGEDGRLKVNFLMNRWNPKKKLHTLYFAPGFPQKYKWIFKTDVNKKDPYGKPVIGVIDRTNEVLSDAGTKMRFEIKDAPEGVKFGDLRYSFIKFMEEANGSSPLGYGPSDANPLTGEIISANSMVWTGSLKYYTQLIAEGLKRGDFETGSAESFYAEMNKAMETENVKDYLSAWQDTSKDLQHDTPAGHFFKKVLPDFTYSAMSFPPLTLGHQVDAQGKITVPANETDIFEFKDLELLKNRFGNILKRQELKFLESANLNGKRFVDDLRKIKSQNDLTIYKSDVVLSGVPDLLLDGKTPQEVIDTILYRVSIHEFGHNLNLRHNFYGSVDKNNHGPGEHLDVVQKNGTVKHTHFPAVSSSVMDYLSLEGEMHSAFEWEAYDKAALAYAYTSGKVDHSKDVYPMGHPLAGEKKEFLFCTDDNRSMNALCNTWDLGTTPTEVVLSLIDTYQKSYFTTNRRFGRAYWDTSNYEARIFGTMWAIKKFIMLDQAAFTYDNKELGKAFKKQKISKNEESKFFTPIQRDVRRAIKISIAFYNAVLQQSNVERQYFSEYDGATGTLLRKGIFADKLYATMFLLGDDAFAYNPNVQLSTASYLEYAGDPDIGNVVKKVSENLLTNRVDSEPGFIFFARVMYADNAVNFSNRNNADLTNSFKTSCYSPEKFTEYFGVNPYNYTVKGETEPDLLVADTINALTDLPEKSKIEFTSFNNEVSEIGFALVDDRVYVASKSKNQIAFNVIKQLKDAYLFGEGDSSDRIGNKRADLRDIRFLYKAMTGAEDYCL